MSDETEIMDLAQTYASAWGLVGSIFDEGCAIDDLHEAKEKLRAAVRGLFNQIDAMQRFIVMARKQKPVAFMYQHHAHGPVVFRSAEGNDPPHGGHIYEIPLYVCAGAEFNQGETK